MKKLLLTVMVLIAALGAVTGEIKAAEKLDSLSYAFGQEFTLASMAGENDLMRTRKDFVDYVKGLEDEFNNLKQLNDSSAVISYYLGFQLCPSVTNDNEYLLHSNYKCIVAALRKVSQDKISLPEDTIIAKSITKDYDNNSSFPSILNDDKRCEFYSAYGVMQPYHPGLQVHLEEMKPGMLCTVNLQALPNRIADCPEPIMAINNSYDFGKCMARTILFDAETDNVPMVFPSIVNGAKCVFLDSPLMPRDEAEKIFEKYTNAHSSDLPEVYELME